MSWKALIAGAVCLVIWTVAVFRYGPELVDRLSDDSAAVLSLRPARELIVQRGDAMVHAVATRAALIGGNSEVHYLARASLRYSVDLRAARLEYQPDSDGGVLTVHVPAIRAEASVDPQTKEKISSLALLSTERGTGNELEQQADRQLQSLAEAEARREPNMNTARRAAQFEIKELYEAPLRAMGNTARVVVMVPGAPAAGSEVGR